MSSNSRRRGGWRGRGGGHRKGHLDSQRHSKRGPEGEKDVNESSPIIQAFRGYQLEMDAKNDRFERIMKLNRDITIDSKRLIFLLQRVSGSGDKEGLMAEAEEKMAELHNTKFVALARELVDQDIYQFLKAFTGGLQEYIEAVTFYFYLSNQELVPMDKIQQNLVFSGRETQENQESGQSMVVEQRTELDTSDPSSFPKSTEQELNRPKSVSEEKTEIEGETETAQHPSKSGTTDDPSPSSTGANTETGKESRELRVPIPPSEYMLGVADFTGELMRKAINSVGAGDLETPRVIADMLKVIHSSFSTLSNSSRELRRKTAVLRQSLDKVERACYTLKVRGSEIPKHMLTDVFTSAGHESFMSEDMDSGYD